MRSVAVLPLALALVLALVLALGLAVGGCGVRRDSSAAHAVTMEGEIVDPQCFYTHGGQGLAHRSCALYCARGGQDLAFLNRAGERVYPLIASRHGADPNAMVIRYVGYPVLVQGAWFEKRGQRVLRIDAIHRLDGGPPPASVDSTATDPSPHRPDSLTTPTP